MDHLMPPPVDRAAGRSGLDVGYDACGYSRGDWSAARSMSVRRNTIRRIPILYIQKATKNDGRLRVQPITDR